MEFLTVYNMLFEPMFSLGGACKWFQGEFHFMVRSEKVYEVVPC